MNNYSAKIFKMRAVLFAAVAIFNLYSIECMAQWSSNPYQNNPVCTDPGTQAKPVMVSDGSGGAIIAWLDDRGGSSIYAQRIDANGVLKWTSDGNVICSAVYFRGYPTMISDGNGGAIISWPDYRNGIDFDIYAQRVNGDGFVQWAVDGVGICTGQGDQNFPILTTDGSGGAIFTWIDNRTLEPMNNDIYAQGINADGSLKWPQTIGISTNPDGISSPAITTDGSGGALISWAQDMSLHNDTSAADIYAQRINNYGSTLWTTDGVSICAARRLQVSPAMAPDGSGGAIITWVDERGVNNTYPLNSDIYAQRINANGVVQWQADGIGISTTTEQQGNAIIISDQAGGAVIAWENWSGFINTILTQRVNGNGSFLWAGAPIGSGGKVKPQMASDSNGGAFVTWEDTRSGATDNYAQHLDASGSELWAFGGVLVSNAYGNQSNPQLVPDNSGGIIITWDDNRNTLLDIYAQHVRADGSLGGVNVSVENPAAFSPDVTVYPNPVDHELSVDVSSLKSPSPVVVSLLDNSGRTVQTFSGKGIITINLDKYKPAAYLLQIRDGGIVIPRLIIKK